MMDGQDIKRPKKETRGAHLRIVSMVIKDLPIEISNKTFFSISIFFG